MLTAVLELAGRVVKIIAVSLIDPYYCKAPAVS